MPLMNKSLFIALPLALIPSALSASEPLTLNEVLQISEKAPIIEAQQSAVAAEQAKLNQAVGAFLPNVTVSERYVRTNDPVSVFAAKLDQGKFTAGDFALDKLNDPASINNFVTRAEIQQPIIHSGVDIYKRKSQEHSVSAVRNVGDFTAQGVRLKLTKLYYGSVAFLEKSKVLKRGIDLLRNLEATYEQASAPTSANQTNYLVAKSVRADLEAQLVRTDTMKENTIRLMLATLGKDPSEAIAPVDPLPPVIPFDRSESEGKRKDVAAALDNYKAMEAAHKQAKWSWGPNLDAFAAYNRYTGNFESSKGSYEGGVVLSWPIFAGPRAGQVGEAGARKTMARRLYEAKSLEADAELANSTKRLDSCREQYQLNVNAAGEASKALQMAGQRYKEGTLPLFDYSQTIQNWANLQQRLIDSQYSFAEAVAEYKYNTGDL